jgi:HD-GYP domain-containing protein (c-di-GMP phosphodiesterase class II)
MTHDRPYRKARSTEEALEELELCAGLHFDPELVRLLIGLLRVEATPPIDLEAASRLQRPRLAG